MTEATDPGDLCKVQVVEETVLILTEACLGSETPWRANHIGQLSTHVPAMGEGTVGSGVYLFSG